jgi:hypothetical protein
MIFQLQQEKGIVILSASNEEDETTLAAMWEAGSEFKYRGRKSLPPAGIFLEAGDREFQIYATCEEQALNLDSVACSLFRSGKLLFLSSDDGAITATTALCKWCDKPVISWWENEAAICDGCSKTCEHKYERQVAYSQGSICMAEVCIKCNAAMPFEEDRTREQIAKELHDERGIVVANLPKKT